MTAIHAILYKLNVSLSYLHVSPQHLHYRLYYFQCQYQLLASKSWLWGSTPPYEAPWLYYLMPTSACSMPGSATSTSQQQLPWTKHGLTTAMSASTCPMPDSATSASPLLLECQPHFLHVSHYNLMQSCRPQHRPLKPACEAPRLIWRSLDLMPTCCSMPGSSTSTTASTNQTRASTISMSASTSPMPDSATSALPLLP